MLHGELHRDQRRTALHPEGAHDHPPAVVDVPDHQVGIGPGAGEEALAELLRAGEVRDRPDLHSWLVDRHEEHRQALVPQGRVGMGAAHDVQPVGLVPERRPHLLTVDDPLVPVEPRPARHRRDVRAGSRLAEALAPDVVDAQDARQEAALLLLGAEREQHRPEQLQGLRVDPCRRGGSGVLGLEDDLLGQRRTAAAVLPRPGEAEPAAGGRAPSPRRCARPRRCRRSGSPPRGGRRTRRRGAQRATDAPRPGTPPRRARCRTSMSSS